MPVREFANQKALIDYAERKGLVFVWAFGKRHGQLLSPVAVFTKRQRLLSPDQYGLWMCAHLAACGGQCFSQS